MSGDNIHEVILDEITFAWFIDIEVVIHVDGNETSRILLKLDASWTTKWKKKMAEKLKHIFYHISHRQVNDEWVLRLSDVLGSEKVRWIAWQIIGTVHIG